MLSRITSALFSTALLLSLPAINACGDEDKQGADTVLADLPVDTASPPDMGAAPDSGDTSTPDTANPVDTCLTPGTFGCTCNANDDCNDGLCVEGPDGKMCTRACVESCPDGFDCRQTSLGGADTASICVPRHVSLCRPCRASTDCRIGTDNTAVCVPDADPAVGSFCATSCANLPCPDGYSCNDVLTGDGIATARLCLPAEGTCECRPAWAPLALATDCSRTNTFGTCRGTRFCTSDGLSECSAITASVEVCNNSDDNCDGIRDNITPSACDLSTTGIASTCPGQTACENGAIVCTGRAPAVEICDGVDNDCDGGPETTTVNCLDSGCIAVPGTNGFVQNGAPACFNGGCVYANPTPCGYFTCNGGGAEGDLCATTCSDDSRCISNATCVGNTCQCVTGYAGASCENCATNWQDKNGDGTCAPACAITPCVQGTCDDSSGTAICTCNDTAHTGPACDTCNSPDYTDPDGDGVCERRGEVIPGDAPGAIARVGKVWRFAMGATQAGSMPNDTFVFSLIEAPEGMVIDAATGLVTWTPEPDDQTWHEDPTQRTTLGVSFRATAPDGQYAEQSVDLEVLPAVFVDGMHPAAGNATGGDAVLVFGEGFVGPAGSIGVNFGEIPATAVTVIDENTLSVTTPRAAARTRPLVIVLDGDPEVELRPGFSHMPVIEYGSADALPQGSNFTLTGEGFDPSVDSANVLSMPSRDRSERRISASEGVTADEATFSLGSGNADAPITSGGIQAIVNGLHSNFLALTITDPVVTAQMFVVATDGPRAPGGSMKLRGSNFSGLSTSSLVVSFSGTEGRVPATVTAINGATEIVVTVPDGAVTGPVFLTAPGRLAMTSRVAAEIPGTTPAPWVNYLTPDTVAPGEALILVGQGFVNANPAAHTVTLDGQPARVLSAEANRLVVEVPADLRIGPAAVNVTIAEQTFSAGSIGVFRLPTRIAGGGNGVPLPTNTSPLGVPIDANSLATDSTGLVYLSDSKRIRAFNRTVSPITAFGQTIPAGDMAILAETPSRGLAIRPTGQDLFFGRDHQIFRMRRSDGTITEYAGQATSGNSGDGGYRLDASFAFVYSLDFTSNNVLVISDYNNGNIRAINTGGATTTLWGIILAPDVVQRVERLSVQSTLGVAVTSDNSLYLATISNVFYIPFNRAPEGDPTYVRRETIAGGSDSALPAATGCPASTIPLGAINYLALDRSNGDLYIGSRIGIIRRIPALGGASNTRADPDDCVEEYAGLARDANGAARPGNTGDGGPAQWARISLTPRPWIDRDGALLISGNGFVRRVTPSADPNQRIITRIAGSLPPSPEGMSAFDTDATLEGGAGMEMDAANNRLIYALGARIVAQDLTTNNLTVLAGSGLLGNITGGNGGALDAEFSSLRGFTLREGRQLLILEAVAPRISMLDMPTRTVSVVAGNGAPATVAQQQIAGPAIDAFVGINTGTPRSTIGPDGLLWYADGDFVRMVNLGATSVTSFGKTLPPGGIDTLFGITGMVVSGVAFDAFGNLYAAGRSVNRVVRVRPSAPTVIEPVVTNQTVRHGRMPVVPLANLRVGGVTSMSFLANGDLVLTPVGGRNLVYIRAHADGTIDGTSMTATVFGTGGPGNLLPDRNLGAQSTSTGATMFHAGRLYLKITNAIVAFDLD